MTLLHGDCRTLLAGLPAASVDAIVTDPPYDLCSSGKGGFMNMSWDATGVAFQPETWTAALRVLKPGGHLVAMGSSRTYHRLVCAIEDAGFEIRDTIVWLQGQGFPKSRDISSDLEQMIPVDAQCACAHHLSRTVPDSPGGYLARHRSDDEQPRADSDSALAPVPSLNGALAHSHADQHTDGLDASRANICVDASTGRPANDCSVSLAEPLLVASPTADSTPFGKPVSTLRDVMMAPHKTAVGISGTSHLGDVAAASSHHTPNSGYPNLPHCTICGGVRIPEGAGTALKPAMELIVLARAPLSEPTVAANVARWGTGALNIGATRIGTTEVGKIRDPEQRMDRANWRITGGSTGGGASSPAGRWPANVVLSHTLFCTPVGTRQVRGSHDTTGVWGNNANTVYGAYAPRGKQQGHTAPDGTETVEAWDCAPDCAIFLLDQQSGISTSKPGLRRNQNVGWKCTSPPADMQVDYADTGGASRFFYCSKASTAERSAGLPDGERNQHPTVKPVALCRWLIRLVCPPGGVVCDPFMGSGSIGVAAREEGAQYIGMEQEAGYLETARQRIGDEVPA